VRDRLIASLPFHYGWLILAGGAIGSFMTLPGQTNGVALFFDPIAGDLALSRSQVALAYTIGTLTREPCLHRSLAAGSTGGARVWPQRRSRSRWALPAWSWR
jgi:hypothetical protein